MADPSKLLQAFMKEFGRAPKSPNELALYGRYKIGTQKETVIPKPPAAPGGITRENIEQGYGYRPQVEKRMPGAEIIRNPAEKQGLSPLMKVLLATGGIGGVGALLSQLVDSETAPAAPNFRQAEDASMAKMAAMPRNIGAMAESAAPDLQSAMTKRKMVKQPQMEKASAPQSAVPQPPMAAPMMDDAALREYFRTGPYQLGVR